MAETTSPDKVGLTRVLLWIAYDILWVIFAALVYGVSLIVGGSIASTAYFFGGPIALAFAILPAYYLFLVTLLVICGAIRWLSPRLQPGIYRKFSKGQFFTLVWLTGLNNVVFAMPFIRTINFIASLRYLYYAGQGMQTHFMNWISVDAVIMDPALVTLGKRVNIGGLSSMTCHIGLQDHMLILPIVIGDGVMVGAQAKIGPGVEIGNEVMVGANAAIGVSVKIGEGAYIEPSSWVESNTIIGPYEKWAGHPAVKIGMRPRPKAMRVAAAEVAAEVAATAVPQPDEA